MNKRLSNAIYTILKPLVGLLFRNGVSFGEFSRLAKLAYIEVTETELAGSGQKVTTSMISISTGLTRKDVSAIRKNPLPKVEQIQKKNRAIRVISAWMSDPQFCTQEGQAKELTIQGKGASFENLVTLHSGDMPYRAMLKELQRINVVELIDDKKVFLIQSAYIPSDDENGKYDFLGEDVSALISTIKHNIVAEGEPFYQRKVSYDRIPDVHIEAFKELANKENQKLLLKLNEWLAKHDLDHQGHELEIPTKKVGVGVYYFETNKKPNKGKNNEKR